jgi:hypothetical protein
MNCTEFQRDWRLQAADSFISWQWRFINNHAIVLQIAYGITSRYLAKTQVGSTTRERKVDFREF